jgi:SufS family cysteine desulfurase
MSTSNPSIPNSSAAGIPAHGDAAAFVGDHDFVPDVALIERLANELFAGVPSGLSGIPNPSTMSLGSSRPPHAQASDVPFDFAAPLDLNLANPYVPQAPKNFDFKPDTGFSFPSNLGASLYDDAVLRDLLKSNAAEHPKMTGATLYFLDEAARFNQPVNTVGASPARDLKNQSHAGRDPKNANIGQIATSGHPAFDVMSVRRDFPILQELVNGRPLAWLDNAATTQKPQSVIDRLSYFYAHENSNIHRAAHELAARATDAYEGARDKTAKFINASASSEIIFVRGTTEAINLVAKSWGKKHIGEGDEIIISHLEHHANIVPWQQLCAETGAKLRVIPVDDDGQVLLGEYERLLNSRTKLVSFTQVSNALGTVTPAKQMIEMAHRAGARVLLDGAQSVSHMRADMQYLDCDFFVFSGHKVFGPTGIGALYGKPEVLEDMPAWQGGGNMIEDVTFEKTRYHPAPNKFEAGTGNIADAVGMGAAIDYVQKIGIDNINRYEHELLVYAMQELRSVNGLRLIGTAPDKTSVLSFVLAGYQTTEVGEALNKEGIAVRTGHHCAQPILRRFGLEATVRPSLAFYNTHEEIDRLVSVVRGLSRR